MFKNYSLQARMVSAFLFMGLIVLIVALIGWSGNTRLTNHIRTIGETAMPSAVALLKIDAGRSQIQAVERSQLSSRLNPATRQALSETFNQTWQEINAALEQYNAIPRNQQEERLYQQFILTWERWKAASDEFQELNDQFEATNILNPFGIQLELLLKNQQNSPQFSAANAARNIIDQMVEQTFNKKQPAFNNVESALQDLITFNQKRGQNANESAARDVTQTRFWVILGMIIGPLTAIIFGLYFSATIARPLGRKIFEVVGVAEKISAGDLTNKVELTDEKSEIGKLQAAFHSMTQNLNSLIRQVQQSGIQITTSTTQIAASGKELEAAVAEQVASTNQVVATAREIAANSGQLVQTMDEVSELSQVTANSASDGQKELIRMQTTMRQLAEATTSISAKLGIISEKANNINSIVTTITKVADQTNLLSLNAAIEAEKAREYGLGFAVVAREIRRLADQTAVATLDIESMVKEMQSAVSTGVMEMDKFTKEVSRGVEDVGGISQQVGKVIEQVQSLNPRFEIVNEGMEAQSQGAQQISEAMLQLREASMQTADALRETNRAIEQLNEAAQNLRQETSRFIVSS